MSTTPANSRRDARGTPPGSGTVVPPQGGRIGNPPFVPTDEQRRQVRNYAKAFPIIGEHRIAVLMRFSRDTLRRHFAEDIELGRAEVLFAIGSQVVSRALDANARDANGELIAKGDLDAQKFVLARLGGWTTKVDVEDKTRRHSAPGLPDLSRLSAADLAEYGRLAAIAEGLDPEEVVGPTDPA
jgi:hypothetical protein